MSGIEFLNRVSRLYPETIRIAMSGYADMAMVAGAINQGSIYKFLTKPVDNKLLRHILKVAFRDFESTTDERNNLVRPSTVEGDEYERTAGRCADEHGAGKMSAGS